MESEKGSLRTTIGELVNENFNNEMASLLSMKISGLRRLDPSDWKFNKAQKKILFIQKKFLENLHLDPLELFLLVSSYSQFIDGEDEESVKLFVKNLLLEIAPKVKWYLKEKKGLTLEQIVKILDDQ